MATQLFANNASTTLNGGITDTATSIVVTDGSVFPSPGVDEYFLLTLTNGTNIEIVKVTGRSTNTLTVTRAQEGTAGFAFLTGDTAEMRVTAGALDNFLQTGEGVPGADPNAIHVNTAGEINALTAVTPAATDVFIIEDSSDSFNKKKISYSEITGGAGAVTESFVIAASDETTALTTGTAKVTFRMPYAFTLSSVKASVTTAPTGATIIVDINEAGTSILSTKLSIDATEKTSATAATPAVISDTALAADAEMTFDIDQVGSTITGAGLKITLIGVQA